jgi:hypothetical protein
MAEPPTVADPSKEAAKATCTLLTIPGELRNRIYEFVYDTPPATDEKVNLLETNPPSRALLQTCGQIYNEAKIFQKEAYRHYWVTSKFFIPNGKLASAHLSVSTGTDQCLSH